MKDVIKIKITPASVIKETGGVKGQRGPGQSPAQQADKLTAAFVITGLSTLKDGQSDHLRLPLLYYKKNSDSTRNTDLCKVTFYCHRGEFWGLPWWFPGKEPTCQWRRLRFDPWVGKIPWGRKWQPTLVFLPGGFQGQRSLTGYSPWGHKELDTA